MITKRLTFPADFKPLHRNPPKPIDSNVQTSSAPVKATNNTPVKSLSDAVKEKMSARKSPASLEPSSPVRLLREIFARTGRVIPSLSNDDRFVRPTKEVTDAFSMDVCRALRAGDVPRLRLLHKQGNSLNGSNQFGESLIHMACRRGDKAVVEFMLKEARVHTNIRDDIGRNVFHDALWTSKANLDVMDVLLEFVSPELLLAPDARGHTPFDYARRDHWEVWCKYLASRTDLLQRRLAIVNEIAS